MEYKQEKKFCKNKHCGKELPPGYKYNLCEACRNKRADKVRGALNVGKKGIGIAASAALFIVSKGRIK